MENNVINKTFYNFMFYRLVYTRVEAPLCFDRTAPFRAAPRPARSRSSSFHSLYYIFFFLYFETVGTAPRLHRIYMYIFKLNRPRGSGVRYLFVFHGFLRFETTRDCFCLVASSRNESCAPPLAGRGELNVREGSVLSALLLRTARPTC